METVLLAGLLVVLAIANIIGAWLIVGRATQFMRYDLDAAAQALKMQAIIDERVSNRIANVQVDSTGRLISGKNGRGLPMQPPDPNVKQTSIIDEVHEAEREAARIMGDGDYLKRDDFTQPPLVEP